VIGLDTNVLALYIALDDAAQSALATKLIESLSADEPGFVSLIALVELSWVLSSCYDFSREQLAHTLQLLTQTKEIMLDRPEIVLRALRSFASGSADFADCLIERIGAEAGCEKTVTFDAAAAKSAGMILLRGKS
jgi:predicted nucleic-acid-binding protein